MATLSTHTLNSVDGDHAGPIRIEVFCIHADGNRQKLLDVATDEGGRLQCEVKTFGQDARYEMVLHSGAYFKTRGAPQTGMRLLEEVVIRFTMPDPDGRYHMPMMLAPNSYSVWFSN